ncbi:hypothetical protein AB4K20DRAFT_2012969 [Rhizopus microsporus]|uniref:Uncharacterized protein n=1 Tax=Rhizopus microsporus TaxID=58291 RepID=A0A1X0RVQ0_RHIZD|nr:hypothetical protein BCV71DRAFT_272631 [Rhizopus microsporus]
MAIGLSGLATLLFGAIFPQFDPANEDRPAVDDTLIENIEKHRDTVYELNGDIATRNQRVDIFTCAMDRLFSYKKTSKPEKYELYTGTGFFSYLDYMNCLRKKKKTVKAKGMT